MNVGAWYQFGYHICNQRPCLCRPSLVQPSLAPRQSRSLTSQTVRLWKALPVNTPGIRYFPQLQIFLQLFNFSRIVAESIGQGYRYPVDTVWRARMATYISPMLSAHNVSSEGKHSTLYAAPDGQSLYVVIAFTIVSWPFLTQRNTADKAAQPQLVPCRYSLEIKKTCVCSFGCYFSFLTARCTVRLCHTNWDIGLPISPVYLPCMTLHRAMGGRKKEREEGGCLIKYRNNFFIYYLFINLGIHYMGESCRDCSVIISVDRRSRGDC